MAYTKEQAHEYYINYRKKGLKKGRKKGSGKKSSSKPKKSQEQKEAEKAQLKEIKDKMDEEKEQELEAIKLELNRIIREKKQMLQKRLSRIKYRFKQRHGKIESGSRVDMRQQDALNEIKNAIEDEIDVMRSEYKAKIREIRNRYKDAYAAEKKRVTGS